MVVVQVWQRMVNSINSPSSFIPPAVIHVLWPSPVAFEFCQSTLKLNSVAPVIPAPSKAATGGLWSAGVSLTILKKTLMMGFGRRRRKTRAAYNPNILEAEAGRPQVLDQSELCTDTLSQKARKVQISKSRKNTRYYGKHVLMGF